MTRVPALAILILICATAGSAQQRSPAEAPFDMKSLEAALSAKPQGADAERLAERIRTAYGGRDALIRGAAPKIDELTVAWALELADPLPRGAFAPRVSRDVGNLNMPMVRVGSSNVYALVRTLAIAGRPAFDTLTRLLPLLAGRSPRV